LKTFLNSLNKLFSKYPVEIYVRAQCSQNIRTANKSFNVSEPHLGGWRKLHNEELHNLYCSPSVIRMTKSKRMSWAGNVARMGEKRNAYRILVGKPKGKRPLGSPRCRWEDNIRINLREIGWGGMDWIEWDQWRALVNTVINFQVP
jgi:hypothetical protein